VSEPLIPVYRKHQPPFVSPCILGEPCPTCAIHAYCQAGHPCKGCRRGRPYECERACPALPAFVVSHRSAIQLVLDGAAVFIHKGNALQLTIEKLAHLRGLTCKIEDVAMFEYAAGSGFIRTAVNMSWGYSIPVITVSSVEELSSAAPRKAHSKAKYRASRKAHA
jgi:hypothetical protein